jgi:hypothetical protein
MRAGAGIVGESTSLAPLNGRFGGTVRSTTHFLLQISDPSDLGHPHRTSVHSPQLAVICVSVLDLISSLLHPATDRRQLIGPGIFPEENTLYGIKRDRTKYCTSSPDSTLSRKSSTLVKPLLDLCYLPYHLDGLGRVEDLPLEMPRRQYHREDPKDIEQRFITVAFLWLIPTLPHCMKISRTPAIRTLILSLTSPAFHFSHFLCQALVMSKMLWMLLLRGTIEGGPSVVCAASTTIWPSGLD